MVKDNYKGGENMPIGIIELIEDKGNIIKCDDGDSCDGCDACDASGPCDAPGPDCGGPCDSDPDQGWS